jgi:hypothetical protein
VLIINLEAVLQFTEIMEHLITANEWRTLVRATSNHIDEDEVDKFIEECEDIFIVPAIGVNLWEELLDGKHEDLADGCTWMSSCGEKKVTKGLKTALAYFVYAKVARNNGAIINRSGFMQHTDEYAQRLEDKQSVNRYNDIMNIAETYLSGCLMYIKDNLKTCITKPRGKRTTIKAIGD